MHPVDVLNTLKKELPIDRTDGFQGNHAFMINDKGQQTYFIWCKGLSYELRLTKDDDELTEAILKENIEKVKAF